jgi:hypothetical protein
MTEQLKNEIGSVQEFRDRMGADLDRWRKGSGLWSRYGAPGFCGEPVCQGTERNGPDEEVLGVTRKEDKQQ